MLWFMLVLTAKPQGFAWSYMLFMFSIVPWFWRAYFFDPYFFKKTTARHPVIVKHTVTYFLHSRWFAQSLVILFMSSKKPFVFRVHSPKDGSNFDFFWSAYSKIDGFSIECMVSTLNTPKIVSHYFSQNWMLSLKPDVFPWNSLVFYNFLHFLFGPRSFAQWSVCRITGTPYCSATARVWYAPATAPAMAAWNSVLSWWRSGDMVGKHQEIRCC